MKKQVITFGEGKIVLWVEKEGDVVICALKTPDAKLIGNKLISKEPPLSKIDLKKSLVLRFENLEGLNVLQNMLDYVRFNLNLKKSLEEVK